MANPHYVGSSGSATRWVERVSVFIAAYYCVGSAREQLG